MGTRNQGERARRDAIRRRVGHVALLTLFLTLAGCMPLESAPEEKAAGTAPASEPVPVSAPIEPAADAKANAGEEGDIFEELGFRVKAKPPSRAVTPEEATPTVTPSLTPARDGSLPQVVEYIRQHSRAPDSIHFVKWYPVQRHERGYFIRCQYAANGGGLGRIEEDKVFYLDRRGKVVNVSAGSGTRY